MLVRQDTHSKIDPHGGKHSVTSKNVFTTLVNGYLEHLLPDSWNNIPIPIVEGFETMVSAVKKLSNQLDIQFELVRRNHARTENELTKVIEDVKEEEDHHFVTTTKNHNELKELYKFEIDKLDANVKQFKDKTKSDLKDIRKSKLPRLEDNVKYVLAELQEKAFMRDIEQTVLSLSTRYDTEYCKVNREFEYLMGEMHAHNARYFELKDHCDFEFKRITLNEEELKMQVHTVNAIASELSAEAKIKGKKMKRKLREEMRKGQEQVMQEVEPVID